MFAAHHLAPGEPAGLGRSLLRMGRAMVDLYCASFRQVPRRIVLDIDDTFDAVHGGQQLRLFNAHYDEYGFQPIVVLMARAALSRPCCGPPSARKGTEIRALLRRVLRAIRANWPGPVILPRADSHYCGPEVLDWCRANGVDFIFGVAPTSTLRRHVERLEASTLARYVAARTRGQGAPLHGVLRRRREWSRVERIIARVEAGPDGDIRFIVTSLPTRNPRVLYGELDCRRGAAENHIKSWKTHLAADRTSCPKASANQFRLFLHAGAYWLMWSVRLLMPKRSYVAVWSSSTPCAFA